MDQPAEQREQRQRDQHDHRAFAQAVLELLEEDETLRFTLANPVNAALLGLLLVVVLYHAMLGLQVVIEDYVHAPAIKLIALVLSRFAHVLLAVAAVFSVLKIGLNA